MIKLLTHKSMENSLSSVKQIQDQVSAKRGVVEGVLPPPAGLESSFFMDAGRWRASLSEVGVSRWIGVWAVYDRMCCDVAFVQGRWVRLCPDQREHRMLSVEPVAGG